MFGGAGAEVSHCDVICGGMYVLGLVGTGEGMGMEVGWMAGGELSWLLNLAGRVWAGDPRVVGL